MTIPDIEKLKIVDLVRVLTAAQVQAENEQKIKKV